ncbi:MAG: hypothetical protein JSW03_00915 [Candidatus Eiseniibacteriota bacterium]|nr:MAG: hypothetical protein JSW03_00915 [Candidatus Eisenbacteria bacterium]
MTKDTERTSTCDVLDLVDASIRSAALGAALELRLFWLLEAKPLTKDKVSQALGIPPGRCHYWLQLLSQTGLIEEGRGGYALSSAGRTAIVEAYSHDTWALLAQESRERLRGFVDLALHIRRPASTWEAMGLTPPMYVEQMERCPERAHRFTRMLYELHLPLARVLAQSLDLTGAERLMDVGGGSGVVSLELARRFSGLTCVVVDIANVCDAGLEIAVEQSLEDRISYHAADFVRDELPPGFDVALECDVNVFSVELFRKVRESLNPGGRFVIVDQLAPAKGVAPPSRVHWAFQGSLVEPEFAFATAAEVREQLEKAGFHSLSERSVPPVPGPCTMFMDGMVVLEARK